MIFLVTYAELKRQKHIFLCEGGFIVIPSFDGKKYILCKMEFGSERCFLCFDCENRTVYEYMNNVDNYSKSKNTECIHVKLCIVLYSESDHKKQLDLAQNNYIEVLCQRSKECISLVHPIQDKKARLPGIVVLNSRTINPKCHTCEGKKCVHVNIYKDSAGEKSDNKKQTETNIDGDLPAQKLKSLEKKTQNLFDPSEKKGKMSNVFKISINFPPSKSEKYGIDKINTVDALFPDGYAIPHLKPGEHCVCGHEYIDKVELGNCESTKMIIHHSKSTKDSRNSSLIVLFRGTLKCDHKKHYLGTEDKLLRVSAIADSGHRSFDSPLHFIAYDFLFEYHSSLISGGTTQNSFVQSKNDINLMIRGQDNEISRGIFRKGYEIFIHSLKYNNEQAWGCELCPKPIDLNAKKCEEDFDEIEVHVSDGINMGTLENDIKGYTDKDIFEEEKNDSVIVKGIEAKERTFLNTIKHRNILKDLYDSEMRKSDVKSAISKIKKSVKSRNLNLVHDLLQQFVESGVPEAYHLLISELAKCTPISVILPSHDKLDYKILQAYLDEKHDIFAHYELANKVTNAFPLVIKLIRKICTHEKSTFLPVQVANIVLAFLELKEAYNKKARECAVPRMQPSQKSPEAEVYPLYAAHTVNNVYEADKKPDKSEEDGCNKDYNESSSFTGGITHITCNNSVVKGFTAMKRGESVKMIVNPCVTRLPPRVQAKRRFLLYDNACKARTYAERRYPHRVRHWTFLVDRKH